MAEHRNIHTPGIIIKKHPVGENDFLVTLYSPDLGKIQAAAKGARKISSSRAGHLETLNLCQFQLYKNRSRFTIVQCQAVENFKKIREDFTLVMHAGLMMEIFHKSTMGAEHSEELFHLLENGLRKLAESGQHFLTAESFKLNLLKQIGALPDLENCASCHTRWQNGRTIWFDANGHLRCHDCPGLPDDARKIEFGIIKLIHYLTRPFGEQNKIIAFNSEQKEQLSHITRFFLQHFLDREILGEKMLLES
jgi:DNA repair protein RecO (recombination protein O)